VWWVGLFLFLFFVLFFFFFFFQFHTTILGLGPLERGSDR